MSPELQAAWEKRRQRGGAGAAAEEAGGLDFTALAPEAISSLVVFLCTDEAANINGRTFLAVGGDIALYSEPENYRSILKKGMWTVDELCDLIPKTLAAGLINPSPPRTQT